MAELRKRWHVGGVIVAKVWHGSSCIWELEMKTLIAGTVAAVLAAGTAQAATLKVELWDVLAGPSTCCAPNPTAAQQAAARVASTGSSTILVNPANPFSANYLPAVNTITSTEGANLTFNIDSSLLAGGFAVTGMTGYATAGQTLNDFFGFDIDGLAAGIGNNSVLGTILRITGFVDVGTGDSYSVRSDDGYSIAIGDGALVVNDGLQAPTTTTHGYTGTSGVQQFSMTWFDNQRVEAALQVRGLEFVDVAPVPLPAGLPLLLVGLGALAVAARRKAALA
jgi:hypothetical protein